MFELTVSFGVFLKGYTLGAINLEKMDPSEIERTYNIRKQQNRFYWGCSLDVMESATILTPLEAVFCFPLEPNIP